MSTSCGGEDEPAVEPCLSAMAGGSTDLPDPITLVGLVFETATGLRRMLTPGLSGELGVGGQSFEILVRLGRSEGGSLRMSDLAAQTGLTPSGLTRAVDRLVEAKLVERQICPSDRRGAFAILTELGQRRTAEALSRHERDVAELLDGVLEPGEAAALIALLRPLRDRVHPEATLVSDLAEQI
ncbi:MAG: MarR family transcriptional regulator [Acidimicrobiaceae bacterium]|jgi:MarR family 2-MHQ and catechol resistance regulon transcriptional repressor|nr:MarR family transcriptional regulator [Acidimicrobiaceae bacterium]